MSDGAVQEKIGELISSNRILLFMKGNKEAPMCGFSAQVVHILNSYDADYETINVLDDWDIREGIKVYSSWPTIPQLYVDGEFVGGCDIIMEAHRKEELGSILRGA